MELSRSLRSVHCGELDLFGFSGARLAYSPSLGRWWLIALCFGGRSEAAFFFSPHLSCCLSGIWGLLQAVVINSESEQVGATLRGNRTFIKKDWSPLKGEYRKALGQSSALKWPQCHWPHSVLIYLEKNGPGRNLVRGCHVCYRRGVVHRDTSKNCWCIRHILYVLKCFNILPWLALFS